VQHHEDADFSGSGKYPTDEQSHQNPPSSEVNRSEPVCVYWPVDDTYYDGTVTHLHQDGQITVLHDDGEKERLDFGNEIWMYESSTDTATASFGVVTSATPCVTGTEPIVLASMVKHFGKKPFLKHQAQGFEQYSLSKAYDAEEETFIKTIKIIPRDDVPADANMVNSHVLYKVKQNEDGSLKLKARITPHGNEDDLKIVLPLDCAICPPTGMRIVSFWVDIV